MNKGKLIYKKQFKGQDVWKEITYDEALSTVLGSYKDNNEVRSMLTIPNWIPCRYSTICVSRITPDGREMNAMPGLVCLIPD